MAAADRCVLSAYQERLKAFLLPQYSMYGSIIMGPSSILSRCVWLRVAARISIEPESYFKVDTYETTFFLLLYATTL